MSGGLYLIRFSDTHYYGGRASSFSKRWAVHLCQLRAEKHQNRYAQNVFNLFGRFEPEVVAHIEGREKQVEAEQEWLDRHVGQPGCLNLSKQAEGGSGGKPHSEATKRKLKEARNKRGPASAATRAKMSASRLAQPADSEGRLRALAALQELAVSRIGKPRSEETRRKISEAKRGVPISRRKG